jgi:uncharacterized protein YndB with AHSA1/START domain
MEPRFQVQLKIRRPAAEVFDGVVNPSKLSGYFVQRASGPLVEGSTVKWTFAEVPGEHDIVVRRIVPNEKIVFEWAAADGGSAADGGYNTTVEMSFVPLDAGNTMVRIAESGWRETPAGVAASYDNCGGWMHMALCLKGYLEYGINLREGGAM